MFVASDISEMNQWIFVHIGYSDQPPQRLDAHKLHFGSVPTLGTYSPVAINGV